MRVVIIVALISLMLTSVNAQDVAPVGSIAAITTYTPCVGDKLIFDYTQKKKENVVIEATIAKVYTGVNAVEIKVTMIQGKEKFTRTISWLGQRKFLESNFLGTETTQREILRIGNFNIETIKVSSGDKSFWFNINANGSSQYPDLIRAICGNQVLVNLRQIIRPKKSKK